jgi:spore coat-associated protein N
MKKFLFLAMAVVLALGMVGAAFAQFHDEETSTGNVFTAGTLDLKVDTDPTSGVTWSDGGLPNINSYTDLNDLVNNLKPGDSISGNYGIWNDGTITGVADIMVTVTHNYENSVNEPEGLVDTTSGTEDGELAQNIDVVLTYNGASVYSGKLSDMSGINYTAPADLAGGATASWEYTISIDIGVGNIIQSDSIEFNIEFSLDQA